MIFPERRTEMLTLATPRTAPGALRQATIFARAEQILADGYSFWPDPDPTMDMVAVCKPGYLHADYWITDGGDFAKHRDFCKHTMAWDIMQRTGLPQFASTSPCSHPPTRSRSATET